MFDETIVVQSAVSAFNNAALATPAFLWTGLLTLPLFIFVFLSGRAFSQHIGLTRDNLLPRISMLTVALIFIWSLLFGGNYAVLRDAASVLPFVMALILFLSTLFLASHTADIPLICWGGASRRDRIIYAIIIGVIVIAVGMSDMHRWWGPLLQIGAVMAGFFIGRTANSEMRPMAGTLLIMGVVTTAILMQPEFFRFGQLGNLTMLHMLGLLVFGVCAVATFATRNIKPAGRIHHSAFIKLKWMARFVTLLCIALYFLTESVPVFLGALAAVFVMCAISIWHEQKLPTDMPDRFFALALMSFGIITTMPAITAMGIVYWLNMSRENFWAESKFLL